MSFSKAKIQRFNDVKAHMTTKSLNEKVKSKTKVGIPPICEKSDAGSSQSVPCFRPPSLFAKKLKINSTNQTLKSKPTEIISVDETLEALTEKIVECENKDAFIKDLTQQLDEFKEKINKIEQEKRDIDTENGKHQQSIENLKNEHANRLKIMREEFRLRLFDTISLKEKIEEQLKLLKKDYQHFMFSYSNDIQHLKKCTQIPQYFKKYSEEYQKVINQKQAELDDKENILKMLEHNTIEMQKQHSVEIEKLRKEQQIEIQDLEFEMLKTMTELQKEKEISANKIKEIEDKMNSKMLEMRNMFENDKERIICQSELKLKQMQETFEKLPEKKVEEQIAKIETEWKNKLTEQQKQSDAILKECQAISEYNIIQCELEKKIITSELQENIEELKKVHLKYDSLVGDFTELKNTYEELKAELDSNKKELEETKKELEMELDEYKKELNKTLKEKSAYEFTFKNSQVTIDVLKRRLIHSDKDVEQLKEELSECEKKILEYEQKNIQLTTDLQKSQLFNEELEMQYESSIKLNCNDINNMGAQLLKEVNNYKNEVIGHKKQMQEENSLKKEIMLQLHDAYDMINRLKDEFNSAETMCCHYKFEVEQSHNELDDYRMREMDWNIIKDKLEFTIKELEDLLESKVQEIDTLNKQMLQLEKKSNSYCESSQYYHHRVKELEEDQMDTENIHKKYIEMSGKYDILACKFEELEAENLQNKMQMMRLSEENSERDALKAKYNNQVEFCDELQQKNEELLAEIQSHWKEEVSLKEEYSNIKIERDALLRKVQQLENELLQRNLTTDIKQHTPKKSKKIKDEENDPKKWIKKNKHSKEDKENVSSPNRTLNSSRMDSPLRDRN